MEKLLCKVRNSYIYEEKTYNDSIVMGITCVLLIEISVLSVHHVIRSMNKRWTDFYKKSRHHKLVALSALSGEAIYFFIWLGHKFGERRFLLWDAWVKGFLFICKHSRNAPKAQQTEWPNFCLCH